MLPGDNLSNRKKLILKALIDAHIELGEPVGSKYLTDKKHISFSPATIRNEMSELEALGYLEQPHTSAGRIPSQLGYRFYVDALMQAYSLTANELQELDNLKQNKRAELDKILDSASKLVSSMTNYTAMAIKSSPKKIVINRFNTMYIDDRNFVLAMICNDESIKSKYIKCDFNVSENELNKLCGVLNNNIAGKTSDMITLPIIMKMEAEMGQQSEILNPIIKTVYELTTNFSDGELKFEGVDKLLEYPEYANVAKIKELLCLMNKKEDIIELVSETDDDNVNIKIGGEDTDKIINDSSIIYKTFKINGEVVGAIGVIGPTRMDYSKVVAMVDYLSRNISKMIGTESGNDKLIGTVNKSNEKSDEKGAKDG